MDIFYALLIPLIYYDLKTEGKFTYNIKIDVGSNIKILELIFPHRIKKNILRNQNQYLINLIIMTYI